MLKPSPQGVKAPSPDSHHDPQYILTPATHPTTSKGHPIPSPITAQTLTSRDHGVNEVETLSFQHDTTLSPDSHRDRHHRKHPYRIESHPSNSFGVCKPQLGTFLGFEVANAVVHGVR